MVAVIYCPPLSGRNLSSYRLIFAGGVMAGEAGYSSGCCVRDVETSSLLDICINCSLFANLVDV